MDNGGSDLALDIVADHRQIGFLEALLPVLFACNKDRNAVDKPHASPENLLNIPLGSRLRAYRQIVHHNISTCVLENFHNIVGLSRRFPDDAREILAKPIMSHTPVDLCIELRNVSKAICIIGGRINSLADIFTHFVLVDVEGG